MGQNLTHLLGAPPSVTAAGTNGLFGSMRVPGSPAGGGLGGQQPGVGEQGDHVGLQLDPARGIKAFFDLRSG